MKQITIPDYVLTEIHAVITERQFHLAAALQSTNCKYHRATYEAEGHHLQHIIQELDKNVIDINKISMEATKGG